MTNLTYNFPDTEESPWLDFIRAVNTAAHEAGEEEGIFIGEPTLIGETWLGYIEPDPEGVLAEGETGREEYPEARLSILRPNGLPGRRAGGEATIAIIALTERAERLFRASAIRPPLTEEV